MKTFCVLLLVLLLHVSCVPQSYNGITCNDNPIYTLVDLAYKRSSEPIELGGEKDEFIVETMAKTIREADEADLVDGLKQLPPNRVAALRLFFTPADFEGRRLSLGNRHMPTLLSFLNSLPPMPPWPIEQATAHAWEKPNMRLDWKSDHGK